MGVGGYLILGPISRDYDISTNAEPIVSNEDEDFENEVPLLKKTVL